MSADTERLISQPGMGLSRIYSPDIQPLLKSILATLADIDFEHESDIETVKNSSSDEWLKLTVVERLHKHHQERRAPHVRQLAALQKRIPKMVA